MKRTGMSSVFRKYLLSYVIILMIPVAAGMISYQVSLDVARNGSMETSRMLLDQTRRILDQRMAEVEGFTRQLAIHQDLNRLMGERVAADAGSTYLLWKTSRDIARFAQTNDFLEDFFVYLRNYDAILSAGAVYYRPSHYYELYHYANMPYERWTAEILEQSHQRTVIPLQPFVGARKEMSVISFVQSLPLNSFNHPPGTAVVIIDQKKISRLLENISREYGGWAYVVDRDGRTLAASGIGEEDIGKLTQNSGRTDGPDARYLRDGTLLMTVRSSYNGWTYAAGVPQRAIMEEANVIKKMTWTVTAVTVAAGLALCLLLAYRHTAPILRLISIFRDHSALPPERPVNDYDFLHGNIAKLISSNRSLQEELKHQLPMLRDAFTKRLLRGEFNARGELEAAAAQSGIPLPGRCGYVGLLHLNGYAGMDSTDIFDELHAARVLLRQRMETGAAGGAAGGVPGNGLLATDIDTDKIAFVLLMADEPDERTEREVERWLAGIVGFAAEYRIASAAAMGGAFRTLADVARSFGEARQTLEHAAWAGGAGIWWYRRLAQQTDSYYYPVDAELRLMNAVKAGEAKEAQRLAAELMERNLAERDLSVEMSQQLVAELKGTLFKLLAQEAFRNAEEAEELRRRIVRIQLSDGLDTVRIQLFDAIESCCELVTNRRLQRDSRTIADIRRFLEERYADADLTLYRIAEHVGRPEKYISQLFKERTGENLSDCLERIRLDKAAELLLQSDLTIEEIAFSVGYNSAHSFRRAFKRLRGLSPSAYRSASE